MSSIAEEWRTLPFSNRDYGAPKLLFKFITSSDGFELYITDLIHCWKDSRNRASITKEATHTRSSIDPSEDASQFDVLLSKLMDGLSGRSGGRCKIGPGWHAKEDKEAPRSFTLLSSTPLPVPLLPLRWTFNLLQEGRMLLTREVILPAVASELRHQTQIGDLKKRIAEKDHVITRLMDKIEQSSMDLSLVFPGYSTGRKGLNAEQATKVVPGISRFDDNAWQKNYRDDELVTTRSLAEAFRKPSTDRLSFDCPRDKYGEDAAWARFGKVANYSEDWMEAFGREPSFTEDEHLRNGGKGQSTRAGTIEGAIGNGRAPGLPVEESTDAFEDITPAEISQNSTTYTGTVQNPPHLSRREHSTSSDDSPPPTAKVKPTKVGNLGGSRSKQPPVSKQPAPNSRISATSSDSDSDSPRPQKKPNKSSKVGTPGGSKKASQPMPPSSSSPPPVPSNHSTPSRKIGALGGKKDRTTRTSSPDPPAPQPASSTSPPTPSRKLGVLGGRHKPATPQKASKSASQHQHHTIDEDLDATDSPSPSPSPSPSHPLTKRKEPESEPETAEEIADRKREELKRTLDSGGGKRKKKRRF